MLPLSLSPMDSICALTSSKPRNPNPQPWLSYSIPSPPADLALPPVPIPYAPPTPVLPYYYYHVAPIYQNFNYFYPVVVHQSPPQWVDTSGGLSRRSIKPDRTTVMIRNLPNPFSRYMLVDFLDQLCKDQNVRSKFQADRVPFEYDFVYLPMDFKSGNNLGYCFVNFTSGDAAQKIWFLLNGYKWGSFEDSNGTMRESAKTCKITWANIQGKNDLIKHFKYSRFVCDDIEYLPVVFSPPRNGATSLISPTTVGNLSGTLNCPPARRRTVPRRSLSCSSLSPL